MRTDDELSFAIDEVLNVSNHALTSLALPNITFSLLGQLLHIQESPGGGDARATSGTDSSGQWTVFCIVFVALFLIEVYVLSRTGPKTWVYNALTTLFWFCCACSFCFYIYSVRGEDDAINWFTGYVLEWLLSVDNLFVFQRIFACMGTPENQRQTALLWGILGAIFFRLVLFMCSQELLHSFWWMHYLFGFFLIYTGVQAMRHQEEELQSDTPLFNFIARRLPYVDKYHPDGAYFFMKVPEQGVADEGERTVWKATRLFLVVVCLELTDFIFAIDAVCVIIAQIPSVYLAFTACVFSMIGVRSLYDVADKLTKYFWCVSYGCALILIFIGLKLMFSDRIHVAPIVVCSTLIATLAVSMLLSVLFPDSEKDDMRISRTSRRRSVPLSVHPMRGSMISLISQDAR